MNEKLLKSLYTEGFLPQSWVENYPVDWNNHKDTNKTKKVVSWPIVHLVECFIFNQIVFKTFSALLSTIMMLTAERQTSMTEAALASQVDQSGSWPLGSFLRAGIVTGSLNYNSNTADFIMLVVFGVVQTSHYYPCLSENFMKTRKKT